MPTQQGGCNEGTRSKIDKMLQSLFSVEQPPEVISCDWNGTAWASFSYISAEVAPASIAGIGGFEPLDDPAWFPMDLLSDDYLSAFEGADWSKVTYSGSYDPVTLERIFLINAPHGRSFLLITSE